MVSKKIITCSILIFNLCLSSFAMAYPATPEISEFSARRSIIESEDITCIMPFVDKNTLVIFDIDYTLIRSKSKLGSSDWIKRLVERDRANGLNRHQSLKKWYPVWVKSQKFHEVELMEDKIPNFLNRLEKTAFGVIALTHRDPQYAKTTFENLDQFGISFDKSPVANLNFRPNFSEQVLYKQGVLFSNHADEKGQVFSEWLKQVKPKIGSTDSIKKIIFIDDLMENVVSMEAAAKKAGLAFFGVRYSAGDAHKANVDYQLILKQAKILMKNLPEANTRKRLRALEL